MNGYDQSIVDVLRSTIANAQDLVRSEIALARVELHEEARRVGKGAAALSAAAIGGIIAVVFLLTAAAWAFPATLGWPAWSGFAIVGGVLLIIAAILGMVGRRRLNGQRHMPLTLDTMRENMRWMRAQRS